MASNFSQQTQAAPTTDLTLQEMLRVMDVAREFRKDRETAEKALARDDFRAELRKKLMRTAELSGDRVTEAEVEAAIQTYLADRNRYADPPMSPSLFVAHLWVRRRGLMALFAAGLITLTSFWGLFWAPFAPLSPTLRAERATAAAVADAQQLVEQIRAVSLEPQATAAAERLAAEITAAGAKDPTTAIAAAEQLRLLHQQLLSAFTVRITQDKDGSNLFDRTFNAPNGERLSGRYVFVQAVDSQGNVVKQKIRNAETDREELVSLWAERIPEEVYQRLREDKLSDGVMNEIDFAKKERGRTEIEMTIIGASGSPIDRSVQITSW
jgi:hypothetical protein